MDDRQGKRSSKAPIIQGLNASVSPVNIQMDNHLVIGGTGHYHHQETNCKSPTIMDSYAEKLDLSSPIARYLCSRSPIVGKFPSVIDAFSTPVRDVINGNYRSAIINHYGSSSSSGSVSFGSRGGGSSLSPLSSVENLETPPVRSPQIYATPVKVDEEVIVMDGILVNSVFGGARTMRSASDSGASSLGKCLYKTDVCRSWEDFGNCRYAQKCQFAHGKEELRLACLPIKNKSKFCKSFGPKFRNSHQLMGLTVTAAEANLITRTELGTREAAALRMQTTTGISIHYTNTKPMPISTKEWSPEDDGIKIILPNLKTGETSNREDVNQFIHKLLYGSSTERPKKRLPVFIEICSKKLPKE